MLKSKRLNQHLFKITIIKNLNKKRKKFLKKMKKVSKYKSLRRKIKNYENKKQT